MQAAFHSPGEFTSANDPLGDRQRLEVTQQQHPDAVCGQALQRLEQNGAADSSVEPLELHQPESA